MKNRLIKNIVDIGFDAEEGHIPSALSILDILEVVYGKILNLDLIKKQSINRDYFILSKGHGCLALYTILEKFKLMNKKELENFCSFNGKLGGHPDSTKNKFIECSTGSLGHGLPMSLGIAFGKKMQNIKGRVITLIGDGECNEGSVWETALLASHHNVKNLTCIIDHNKSTDRALKIDSLLKKFLAFNWDAIIVDGHDHESIYKALKKNQKKPLAIIANTIKGKGISFMENNPEWHHKKIDSLIKKKIYKNLKFDEKTIR